MFISQQAPAQVCNGQDSSLTCLWRLCRGETSRDSHMIRKISRPPSTSTKPQAELHSTFSRRHIFYILHLFSTVATPPMLLETTSCLPKPPSPAQLIQKPILSPSFLLSYSSLSTRSPNFYCPLSLVLEGHFEGKCTRSYTQNTGVSTPTQ